jgi:D-tyrosyl-tRNA(Tyr) deacylase
VEKISNLRIFPDEAGKMNLSLLDIKGELLVISQFTLYGDCRKGRRPGFDAAMPPAAAKALYEFFLETARKMGLKVSCGQFQADMKVSLDNMGPVTMLLDSKRVF